VYGYSFIVTNLDVSTPDKAAAVEHWYRHRTCTAPRWRTTRDAKHGAALNHLPSGHPQVNTAWMWGALLAVSIAGWTHQLTATPGPDGQLLGHGVRDGQAMIATLRHKLIRVPARLVRHAGALTLRLPPGHHLLEQVHARLRSPSNVLTRPNGPEPPGTPPTRGDTRAFDLPRTRKPQQEDQQIRPEINSQSTRESGQMLANAPVRLPRDLPQPATSVTGRGLRGDPHV